MAADNFTVNYEDERFKTNEAEMNTKLNEVETTFNGMIDSTKEFYKQQGENIKNYADTQKNLQQEKTDLAIEQIEQKKEKEERDYLKEQSAAYVDYQKQIDPHGVQAEQMAASGLAGSGYSESSKVSMYNTYQNRIASARESYKEAILNYDNLIAEARLQNSTILAEIAFNAQKDQLELALEGFQYENSLILGLFEQKQTIENNFYTRRQDILNQINTENAMRQEQANWEREYALEQAKYNATYGEQEIDKGQKGVLLTEEEFKKEATAVTKGNRGNTGNGGYYLNGIYYADYEEYLSGNASLTSLITNDESANQEIIVNDRKTAVDLLVDSGVSAKDAGSLLYEDKWNSLKSRNSTLPEVKNFGTYKEYLQHYTNYLLENNKSSTKSEVNFSGKSSSIPVMSNREMAIKFLRDRGVAANYSGSLLNESEWKMLKNGNSTASEVKNFRTYGEYLQSYTKYLLETYAQ